MNVATDFLTFTVSGKPAPAGSKRAIPTRRDWQRVPGVRWRVVDANVHADHWKELVAQVAAGKMLQERRPLMDGPLWMQMIFTRSRPQSHTLVSGELSAEGRRSECPTGPPDALKLARAVEDALTGIVYRDDSQIVSEVIQKRWGDDGVTVTVMPL